MTKQDRSEAASLYLSGLSLQKVAEHFGVTKQYIHQVFIHDGVDRRPRKQVIPASVIAEVAELAGQGLSNKEIGSRVSLGDQTVKKILEANDIVKAKRQYVCHKCGGHEYIISGGGRRCAVCFPEKQRNYYRNYKK